MSAVLVPFPSSLSPSRAGDFMTCPLLFRFRSIDRLPEEPSAAAVRGTLVHRALETLYDLPAVERTHEAATVLVDRAFRELERTDPASAMTVRSGTDGVDGPDVTALLTAYFGLEDPRRLEPHARELGVSAQIAEAFEVRGFIDRIDLSDDGRIRIVDYKTGRSPGAGFESKAMFQMRFYALVWWRMTGDVPTLLQLMYLGNAEVLRYEPTEDDLRATERKILALRDAIARAADAGQFDPSPSRLCDWCSHKALCPAWGGSPPPLPPRADWPTSSARTDAEPEPEV
ncbi:MAG: PD-(D/E)XK nuclease family protein [Actinobacteria bacterium]|jgi:putative RecB family exonuclease|nr:PD-(D/E)XK nuclease family protein [Actinomycetota bacterium]